MKNFRITFLIILIIFLAIPALYALNLDNNGYDWKHAKYEEKIEIGKELGKEDGSHHSFWIDMLDDFYNNANDKELTLSIRRVSQSKVHDFLQKEANRAVRQMNKQRTKDIISLFIFIPLLYLVPVGIISLVIILIGRNKAGWLKYEYPFLLVPFFVYLITPLPGSKSFSNLVEFIYCGLVAGFIPLPRLFIRAKTNNGKVIVTIIATIIVSIIAVGIKFFTPFLME